jgi:hypothetical protein
VKSENGAGLQSPVVSTNGQTITLTAGISNITESDLINIYPNPFSNTFLVSLNLNIDSNVELTLIDALGKEIAYYQTKESAGVFNKTIDASSLNLSSGTYLVRIKLNEKVLLKKMIKQ